MIEKQEVIDWVTELLCTYGYNKHKRKKYLWLKEEIEFTKYIKLNHSNFGNYFHVEYAFDLHALEREKQGFHHWGQINLHFWGSRTGLNTEEGFKKESFQDVTNESSSYKTAFDLDIPLDDKIRKQLMQEVIIEGVVNKLERIQTLDDLKKELQTEDEKYFVSLAVEDFLGISNE